MFLNRGDRLAIVDFEDRKINYTELVNNVKYFSENVIPAEKEDFGLILIGKQTGMDLYLLCFMGQKGNSDCTGLYKQQQGNFICSWGFKS